MAELADHRDDHLGRPFEERGTLAEVDALQAIGDDHVALGELLDGLGNLVQRGVQRLDVFAVQGGDEGVHQFLADLAVQGLLAGARRAEGGHHRGAVGFGDQFMHGLGAFARGVGAGLEQAIELVALTEDRLE